MTDHELRKAARSFAELFVADNGDPTLSVDDIDMIGLTHRYVELEAALATTEPGRASMANPDHDRGIEAAKKAFYRNMDPGLGVEEAISAYLATIEPGKPESGVLAEAVKVKPLQWQMLPPPFATGPLRPTARMPLGTYTITEIFVGKDEHITWFSLLEGAAVGSGPTQDHAKAAAQADYEQRVMSALSTPPQPEALQRRVEELEAALKPFADRANRYNEVPGIIRFDDSCELWQLEKNKGMEVDITVGDLRRARAALIKEQKKDG